MKFRFVKNQAMTIQLVVSAALVVLGTLLAMWRRGVAFESLNFIQAHGDGLGAYALAKGFSENPWSVWNYQLGYPNGLSILGQPGLNWIHTISLWVLVWILGQPIAAVNFLFFLGFGLAVASSWWVLNFYKVRFSIALILAFSFAFIPEHWQRQSHLYLSLYWTIPLSCFYLIQINNGGFGRYFRKNESRKNTTFKATIFGFFLLFLVQQGVYYALFTFLLTSGTFFIRFAINRRLDRNFKISLAILMSHALLLIASLGIETKLAQWSGTNLSVFARSQFESLLYGGLMPQLIYPWPGSGLYLASESARQFPLTLSRLSPGGNENQIWQGLIPGTCIALAIIFIILQLSKRPQDKSKWVSPGNPQIISTAMLIGILFYIAGGLGFILAAINPQIRAWNRLSFHITFLAVILVGILLSSFFTNSVKKNDGIRKVVSGCVAAILATIFFLDSLPKGLNLDLTSYRNQSNELNSWVRNVESQTGGNCPILQLPLVSYPEMPPTLQMDIYEQFLPYLVSNNFKFSFGSMKNSKLSNWQNNLPTEINTNLMRLAAGNGFCAIIWDSLGLSPENLSKLRNASNRLELKVVESASERWGSVNLVPLAEKMNEKEKLQYSKLLLDAPQLYVLNGLSGVEKDDKGLFSWATNKTVKINVYNPGQKSTRFKVGFSLSTSPSGMRRQFQILWQGQSKIFTLEQTDNREISLEMILNREEEEQIEIKVSGGPDSVPSDPRLFYFRMRNNAGESINLSVLKGDKN